MHPVLLSQISSTCPLVTPSFETSIITFSPGTNRVRKYGDSVTTHFVPVGLVKLHTAHHPSTQNLRIMMHYDQWDAGLAMPSCGSSPAWYKASCSTNSSALEDGKYTVVTTYSNVNCRRVWGLCDSQSRIYSKLYCRSYLISRRTDPETSRVGVVAAWK